jgi:hypothetical protein
LLDIACMVEGVREDLLAFSAPPIEHWRKIWATNSPRAGSS